MTYNLYFLSLIYGQNWAHKIQMRPINPDGGNIGLSTWHYIYDQSGWSTSGITGFIYWVVNLALYNPRIGIVGGYIGIMVRVVASCRHMICLLPNTRFCLLNWCPGCRARFQIGMRAPCYQRHIRSWPKWADLEHHYSFFSCPYGVATWRGRLPLASSRVSRDFVHEQQCRGERPSHSCYGRKIDNLSEVKKKKR